MPKILVTGANKGFIGSHFAKKLKHPKNKIKLFSQDEWQSLNEVMSVFSPDRIFHFASYGNHYSQKDLNQTLDVNIFKTYQLLEASLNLNFKSFILIGSSSEYGKKKAPMKETDLLEPDTFYGASKAAATLLTQVWAKNFNKPVVIIRPFSIYGPGEADHRFIPTLVRSCLLGEAMKLDPTAVHDWLYVSDLIDGILLAAKRANNLRGKIINFGSGIQSTNQEIVEIVENILGKKANIGKRGKSRSYDKKSWVADITIAKSLGWKPKVSLVNGLKKTVKYHEKILKRAKI